jgi:hypothetical protein
MRVTCITLPQGPSLRSGFYCPGPSSLTWPHPSHLPAQRDFAHGGLYALPSLCGSASATDEWFRAFAACSVSTCHPPRPRGVRRLHAPSALTGDAGLHTTLTVRHSRHPTIRSTWASNFGATSVRFAAACRLACLPSGSDRDTPPANGDVYTRASDESVTLPVAEYDYDGSWAASIGGTSTRRNSS